MTASNDETLVDFSLLTDKSTLFDIVTDYSCNLIFIKDRHFRIIMANQAFFDLFPPELHATLLGRTLVESFTPEEAVIFLEEDRRALEQGSAELIEQVSDWKGQHYTLQTRKVRFYGTDGKPYILGICNDISQIAAREKSLAQSNMALAHYAAVAAHDLRSPLGSMMSCIEMIQEDERSYLGPQAQRYLTMMEKSAKGLVEQITQLLQTYKQEDVVKKHRADCDLGLIIEEIKFNLSQKLQAKGGKILSNALPTIQANHNSLRQLFQNLIENSLKYCSEAVPVIIVRYRNEGIHHFFSVEDNGIGIPKEQKKNFLKFFKHREKDEDSYGIGLTLCKKIVQAHHGQIWLDPSFETGCRICFTLPKEEPAST